MARARFSSFVLLVADVTRSRGFYTELLDQEVAMDINNVNVGFKSGLAIWDRAHANGIIHGEGRPSRDGDQRLEIYFETDDLEIMHARMVDRSVPFVHGIKTQPWQQRVFRVYEPDGFVVEIAETMPDVARRLSAQGLSVAEIAAKTFMPAEAVETMLREC